MVLLNKKYLFSYEMNKILKQTSRGQVTLPKKWREKFDTDYFVVEENEDALVLKPLKMDSLKKRVDSSWKEYQDGDFQTLEEVSRKYEV